MRLLAAADKLANHFKADVLPERKVLPLR